MHYLTHVARKQHENDKKHNLKPAVSMIKANDNSSNEDELSTSSFCTDSSGSSVSDPDKDFFFQTTEEVKRQVDLTQMKLPQMSKKYSE